MRYFGPGLPFICHPPSVDFEMPLSPSPSPSPSASAEANAKTHVLVGWLLTSMVLMLTLLGYFLHDRYDQANTAAGTETRNLAQLIESHLSNDFSRVDSALHYVALGVTEADLHIPRDAASHSALGRQLVNMQASFPLIRSLNIFDAQGDLIYASNPRAPLVNIADRSHFQYLRDNPKAEVAFSNAQISRTTGQWSLAQVRALRDAQGHFLGTVNAVTDIERIGELFNQINMGPGSLILLRRSDTSVLIQRTPRLSEKDFNQPLPLHNLVRQRIDAGERMGTIEIKATTDGVERLVTFKVMDNYPFYIQVALAKDHYLANWWQSTLGFIILAILLFLGFCFSIWNFRKNAAIAHISMRQLVYRQALFSGLFEQSGFLAGIIDRSGKLLEVNQTALDVIGMRREDVVGRYFPETPWWSRSEDKMKLHQSIEAAARGVSTCFEMMHPTANSHNGHNEININNNNNNVNNNNNNNNNITVLFHAVPVCAGNERYIAVTGINITERKQAEQALKESESRQRAIIDNEPECIKIIDAQGRLVQMNPAGLRMIEADTFQQVAGQRVKGLIAPEHQHAFAEMHERVLAGETVQLAFEIIGLKGGRHWMETHAVPIQENGQTVQLAVTRDITERKLAEIALQQQTQALARSNAELEQFAYVASHDLRQPLRMVSSYVQLLERRLAAKLDDETLQMMHFAADGAKRMDQMLVALLEYSRVGRKGQPMVPMFSRDGVEEALRFLAPAISEAKAVVRVSGDWPHIVASRDEFTRLWQNLIGNAVKYRAPDRVPELEIAVAPEADGWRFSVTDNGIGIDSGQFNRLFQVFQRLQTREKYEGTGIGLAVARKIAERHGGTIGVESAGTGQGCCFYFKLPLEIRHEPL